MKNSEKKRNGKQAFCLSRWPTINPAGNQVFTSMTIHVGSPDEEKTAIDIRPLTAS